MGLIGKLVGAELQKDQLAAAPELLEARLVYSEAARLAGQKAIAAARASRVPEPGSLANDYPLTDHVELSGGEVVAVQFQAAKQAGPIRVSEAYRLLVVEAELYPDDFLFAVVKQGVPIDYPDLSKPASRKAWIERDHATAAAFQAVQRAMEAH